MTDKPWWADKPAPNEKPKRDSRYYTTAHQRYRQSDKGRAAHKRARDKYNAKLRAEYPGLSLQKIRKLKREEEK